MQVPRQGRDSGTRYWVTTDFSHSTTALQGTAHTLNQGGTLLVFFHLPSPSVCQHYCSLLTCPSDSLWCLPKGSKLILHDLSAAFFNPLGFRKRLHEKGKSRWVWGEVTVRSFNQAALLLEECWRARFTTRTDRFPLFCFYLGEGSAPDDLAESIKPACGSKSRERFTASPFGEGKWWSDLDWEAVKPIPNGLSKEQAVYINPFSF